MHCRKMIQNVIFDLISKFKLSYLNLITKFNFHILPDYCGFFHGFGINYNIYLFVLISLIFCLCHTHDRYCVQISLWKHIV